MKDNTLKSKLIKSLEQIYYMEAFSQLVDFLQGELYLLSFLASNKDKEYGPSELSQILNISRPRITTTISTLKEKKFVKTELDKEDRRRLKVRPTKKGEEFIYKKQRKVEDNFDLFIDGIGEKDTLELIRIINRAAEIMKNKDIK